MATQVGKDLTNPRNETISMPEDTIAVKHERVIFIDERGEVVCKSNVKTFGREIETGDAY